jgi:hypothetical protein
MTLGHLSWGIGCIRNCPGRSHLGSFVTYTQSESIAYGLRAAEFDAESMPITFVSRCSHTLTLLT